MNRLRNPPWRDHRAELAALADGSLRGRRRARLEAVLARSPGLRSAYEEQRLVVEALRSLDVGAPEGLRERVDRAAGR